MKNNELDVEKGRITPKSPISETINILMVEMMKMLFGDKNPIANAIMENSMQMSMMEMFVLGERVRPHMDMMMTKMGQKNPEMFEALDGVRKISIENGYMTMEDVVTSQKNDTSEMWMRIMNKRSEMIAEDMAEEKEGEMQIQEILTNEMQ